MTTDITTTEERIAYLRLQLESGKLDWPSCNAIAFLLAELDAAKQLNADWEAASLVGGPRIDALRAELDAARAREAKLREALDSLADAVEVHQSQAWATSDIDTALARAALAEGEDTRG